MTLPERIQSLLKRAFAALHPCLYGPMGGGESSDLEALFSDLEKDVALLMPGTDAHAVIMSFRARIPEVRRLLETDISAAYEGDPAATCRMEVVMAYPGLYAVTVHRLAHELYKLKVPIIPRIMSEYAHSKTGIDIHPETTVIGRNVKLYQGVTLGALSFPKDETTGMLMKGHKRHPNVEDNVVIYAGATILGGDTTIGHDSEIGGNVWLMDSIPPFSRVYNQTPFPRIKTKV